MRVTETLIPAPHPYSTKRKKDHSTRKVGKCWYPDTSNGELKFLFLCCRKYKSEPLASFKSPAIKYFLKDPALKLFYAMKPYCIMNAVWTRTRRGEYKKKLIKNRKWPLGLIRGTLKRSREAIPRPDPSSGRDEYKIKHHRDRWLRPQNGCPKWGHVEIWDQCAG